MQLFNKQIYSKINVNSRETDEVEICYNMVLKTLFYKSN